MSSILTFVSSGGPFDLFLTALLALTSLVTGFFIARRWLRKGLDVGEFDGYNDDPFTAAEYKSMREENRQARRASRRNR